MIYWGPSVSTNAGSNDDDCPDDGSAVSIETTSTESDIRYWERRHAEEAGFAVASTPVRSFDDSNDADCPDDDSAVSIETTSTESTFTYWERRDAENPVIPYRYWEKRDAEDPVIPYRYWEKRDLEAVIHLYKSRQNETHADDTKTLHEDSSENNSILVNKEKLAIGTVNPGTSPNQQLSTHKKAHGDSLKPDPPGILPGEYPRSGRNIVLRGDGHANCRSGMNPNSKSERRMNRPRDDRWNALSALDLAITPRQSSMFVNWDGTGNVQ